MIEIGPEDVVTVDGKPVPVSLVRALAAEGASRVLVETDSGQAEEVEIERHEGGAVTWRRHPRSGRGSEHAPIATEALADLRGPGNGKEWVVRGSERHRELEGSGWTESGVTQPKVVRAPEEDVLDPRR